MENFLKPNENVHDYRNCLVRGLNIKFFFILTRVISNTLLYKKIEHLMSAKVISTNIFFFQNEIAGKYLTLNSGTLPFVCLFFVRAYTSHIELRLTKKQ